RLFQAQDKRDHVAVFFPVDLELVLKWQFLCRNCRRKAKDAQNQRAGEHNGAFHDQSPQTIFKVYPWADWKVSNPGMARGQFVSYNRLEMKPNSKSSELIVSRSLKSSERETIKSENRYCHAPSTTPVANPRSGSTARSALFQRMFRPPGHLPRLETTLGSGGCQQSRRSARGFDSAWR